MSTFHSTDDTNDTLSLSGILIGCLGCVVITASSVFTALKMGSLPWPTIFTSLLSLVLLRMLGRRSLREANMVQVVMSAGSMVAGGIAFTIPGIFILGLSKEVPLLESALVAAAGVLLGLVCTALVRKHFIEHTDLNFPIGTAAAHTLTTVGTDERIHLHGARLFGSMGIAGLIALARDWFGYIPSVIPLVSWGSVQLSMMASPMLASVGYLLSSQGALLWMLGALIAQAIHLGGALTSTLDTAGATAIIASSGMGLMMGSGVGVMLKDVLIPFYQAFRTRKSAESTQISHWNVDLSGRKDYAGVGLMVAAAVLLICIGLQLDVLATVIVVLLSFVTTIMSAQSVGQTGIDPMEIFGLIVLLIIAACSHSSQIQLFYVAGIIAVACGLAGDVMSDFKTGALLQANPRALWKAQVIGSVIGVFVSTAVLYLLVQVYGVDAFGVGRTFVSAQAQVVATMVSGIPHFNAFIISIIAGALLHFVGISSMMLGLGIYLPFPMSCAAAVGAVIKFVQRFLSRKQTQDEDSGIIIASGILGGESIVGVCIALATMLASLMQ